MANDPGIGQLIWRNARQAPWRELALALLLGLATHIAFVTVGRWTPEPELAFAPEDLVRQPELWRVDAGEAGAFAYEDGALWLRNPEGERGVEARFVFPLPERDLMLRLTADVAVVDVEQGIKRWYRGRVYLVAHGPDEEIDWRRPHGLMSKSGTTEALRYRGEFVVSSEDDEGFIALSLHGARGAIAIERLWLETFAPLPAHQMARPVLLAGWLALGLWCLFAVGRGMSLFWLAAGAVLAAALIAGAYAPERHTFALTGGVMAFFTGSPEQSSIIGDWGHALGFALLGLIAPFARADATPLAVAASLIGLAAVTELTQHFTFGRTPLLGDFAWDLAGLGVGLAMAWTIRAARGGAA